MKPINMMWGCCLGLSLFSGPLLANDDPLITALKDGQPILDMRLRYEGVDDSTATDADALTLRTRLGWQTGTFYGVDALVDVEDVRIVGKVDNFAPNQPGFPVVPDPEVTQLNQAVLRYQGQGSLHGFSARYGRQRIIYDNARFIGNVGWRQNEQTFDGVKFDYQQQDYALSVAHVTQVNGITPAFDASVSSTLINARWDKAPGGSLGAYGYLLKDQQSGAENDTYGLRYNGSWALQPVAVNATVEGARQEVDAGSTHYYALELAAAAQGVTIKVGQEVLGSDSGVLAFQTPLATKHAFNGWSDQFLVTPADGLQDRYLGIAGALAGVRLAAVYHDFSADQGNTSYGSELNLLAARAFGDHYQVGLKYADYSADELGRDTRKMWAWVALAL